ncbi:uncharacterized protein LOC144439030 [Glandiceps talaboti]
MFWLFYLHLWMMLLFSCAKSIPNECRTQPGVCKHAYGCTYTFLLPIPDHGECFNLNQAAGTISPGGQDISAMVKRIQNQGDKSDSLKRILMQQLWRIDELEAQKHQLTKINNEQAILIGQLETENLQLRDENAELGDLEDCRLENQRLSAEVEDVRTSLEQQSDSCADNGEGTHVETEYLEPNETSFVFNGTSAVVFHNTTGGTPELTEFTMCLWMKMLSDVAYNDNTVLVHYQAADNSEATTRSVSYAVTFYLEHIWDYRLRGGSGVTLFNRIPRDSNWHHVCVAWVGRIGKGRRWLYLDGTGTILGDGHVERLLGDGTLYLGYRPIIDYRQTTPYIGEMSLFQMWDKKLSIDEIQQFANQCEITLEGSLISWSTMFGEYTTLENIERKRTDICSRGNDVCGEIDCLTNGSCIQSPVADSNCSCPSKSPCQSEGRKIVFDGSTRVDVNFEDETPVVEALTICLWLRTTVSSKRLLFRVTAFPSNSSDAIQHIKFHDFRLSVTTYGDETHNWYSYLTLDPAKVTDDVWHHVCLVGSMAGSAATFRIYKDGMMITRPYFRQALTMTGIESISLGGASDALGFPGDVYGFQFWTRDLSNEEGEIYLMSRRCGDYTTDGAYATWSTFKDVAERDGIALSPVDICT